MEKWNNQCPKCGSKNIREDAVDVYYSRNPSHYYCEEEGCGTEVIVESVPMIKEIIENG